jgi:hypothetical protein
MPEISRFLGIVIGMFYREHGQPHFRTLPPTAMRLVLEWASLHRAELLENWQLARQGQPLHHIAPLE